MLLWWPQILIAIYLHLTCAEITTEPYYVTLNDYHSYMTFPIEINESINTNEKEDYMLSSVFDLNNYDNACNGSEVNETRKVCETLENGEREICEQFQEVMKSVMDFSCYLSESDAEAAMNASVDYLDSCKEGQMCAKSEEIVEILMKGLKMCNTTEGEFMNLAYSIQTIVALQKRVGPVNESYAWELIVKHQAVLVNDLDKYVHNVRDLLIYLRGYNLTNIFITPNFSTRINLPQLELILDKQSKYLIYCQEMRDTWNKIDIVRYEVRLTLFVIFFILGMVGNIILLMVFMKYPDMRSTANIVLINLTMVDCVCLLFNLPLTYLKTTSMWSLGTGGCQGFYFIRYMTICVSTYSVVMISFQRFLAVTRFPTADGCTMGEKTKSIIILSSVWLLGILYSLPRLIFSEIFKGMCTDVNDDIIGIMVTSDFVIICVIPSLLMAVFSFLTATKIKKSVSNPTGERTGQEQLRQNRMISAHVLTGLAVLFVVSYFPSFLLYLINFQVGLRLETFDMYVVDTVTYILQFTNSCLNPLALCVMSRKYRKYFKEILSCCKIPLSLQKALASSDSSVATTESSI